MVESTLQWPLDMWPFPVLPSHIGKEAAPRWAGRISGQFALVSEGTIQDGTWDGKSQGLSAQTGCLRRPGLKPAFHKLPVLGPGVYLRVRGIADLCQPTTLSSSNGWVPVAIGGRSHLFGGRVLSSFYLLSSSYSAAHIYIEIIHMCVGGTVAQAVAKHGRKGKVHWETSSDPALLLVH